MKGFVLALLAVSAASCTAPTGSPAPTRRFTLDLPPGCALQPVALEDPASVSGCIFTSATGRARVISTKQFAVPFDEMFDRRPETRLALRLDPKGFWWGAVMGFEALAARGVPPGDLVRDVETRPFPTLPGSEACAWFVLNVTSEGRPSDTQGVRCMLYDPGADVAEMFMLEYVESRAPGAPPDPGFAADAERVARTLRFAPPGR